jgi:two-component system nitrogen regulation sensor histidine kinase NtrY
MTHNDAPASAPLPKIPWWGRLESRVIAALALLGVLCVGASAYLVELTVGTFEGIVGATVTRSELVVEIAASYYSDLVEARKATYEARSGVFLREIVAAVSRGEGATVPGLVDEIFAREADLVSLEVRRGEAPLARRERESALPEDGGAWIWVPGSSALPRREDEAASLALAAVFAMDPAVERRHEALEALRRESGLVSVGARTVDYATLDAAVTRAMAAASALVLMIAFIAGSWMARATTRRVSQLSAVIRAVAAGDREVRARARADDEMGQLGAAFNQMLEQLDAAQRKLAYLQRVSAWQDMARRIAHEIKNPLTPILLAVQQLREKDPQASPEFSRLLAASAEIVEDEVEGLRRMVATFSSFAKVPEARPEPVELARLFAEFTRAYGHLTESGSDTLEVIAPPVTIEVVGDRQLLKQCLVNLVENAVLSRREADEGPLHVRISARVDDLAGMVEVWVEDNGPGIPVEMWERVFEPYVSSRRGGSGLGLAIVKKIALDLGGEARVAVSSLGGAAIVLRLARRSAA